MKLLTKRFTALAIAFVITALSLPISTQAACNHQPNSDANGNVIVYITETQHYNICATCCNTYNRTSHINDGNNVCNGCGVGLDNGLATHTHTTGQPTSPSYYGYKDRFGHMIVCSDPACSGLFETHTNMNGVDSNNYGGSDCDYCGWANEIVGFGCVHDFTGSTWHAEETRHYAKCISCNHDIFGNHEDSTGPAGFCDVCNAPVVFDTTEEMYIHNHTYYNFTGKCDTCAYPCPHDGYQWYDTDEDEHQLYCGGCGTAIGQLASHNDATQDGKCDVCQVGVVNNKHNHVWKTEWEQNDSMHFHLCEDSKCGKYTDSAAHDDSDGDSSCDTCGYCLHTSAWFEIDEEEHRKNCKNCQEQFAWESHADQGSDGLCDGCGTAVTLDLSENVFKHTHTYSSNWYSEIRGHYHECTDTVCTAGDGFTKHKDLLKNSDNTIETPDGDCDECGYTMCTHQNTGIDGYEIGPEGHKPFCAACGGTMIPATQRPDAHVDAVDNSDNTITTPDRKCDVCGATVVANPDENNRLEHTHTPGRWVDDGPQHSAPCSGCSYIIFRENHVDRDGDRVCNDCGANMGGNQSSCQHNHYSTNNNGFAYDIKADQHFNICADCHEPVNGQNHYDDANDNDSVCDTCGVALDTNGQHVHNYATEWGHSDKSHYYACLDDKCNATKDDASHEDKVNNDDNTQGADEYCDVCGYFMCSHKSGDIVGYVIGTEGHKAVCADCEKTIIPESQRPEAHVDAVDNSDNDITSPDGKCDVCGATVVANPDENNRLEHTHEPDEWTNQGPNHTAPCKGCDAHVFKEGHVDDDNDGECDLCQASMGGGQGGPGQSCSHQGGFWIKIEKNTHQGVCGYCNQALGSADPHVETDGDNRCDECGAPVVVENGAYVHNHNPHPHGWYANTETHFYKCDTCGMTTFNFDNHVDDEDNTNGAQSPDGLCDVCNVSVDSDLKHNCPNSALIWKAMGAECHALFCTECYNDFEQENHVDNVDDNVCDKCNVTLNSDDIHEHVPDGNWTEDGYQQHCCPCTQCEEWAYEGHVDNNNDEKCDICNGDTTCNHPGNKWYGIDEEFHELHCGDCGNSIQYPESHNDAKNNEDPNNQTPDGKCDVCGVGVVNNIHTHVWSSSYDSNPQNHWQPCTDNACGASVGSFAHEDTDGDDVCDVCGNRDKGLWCPNHWPNGEWLTTDDYHYPVCGACWSGYGAGSAHNGADGYRWETNKHYPVCIDCHMAYGPGSAHADTDSDGSCDVCELSINANGVHTHSAGEWSAEVQVHTQYCDECNQEVAKAAHTDDGTGKCSVCKASLDASGQHRHTEVCTYLNNMVHVGICSGCGQETDYGEHEDADKNKVCDVCNHTLVTLEASLAAGIRATLAAQIEAAVIKAANTGDYTDMKTIFDAPDHILEPFVDNYKEVMIADPGAYIDALIMSEVYLEEDFAADADSKAIIDRAKAVIKDSAMSKYFTMDIIGSLVYTDGSSTGMSAYPLNGTQNFDFVLKLDDKDVKSNRTWYVVVSNDEGETFTKLAESAKGASEITFTHASYYDHFVLLYTEEAVQNPSGDSDSSNDSGSGGGHAATPTPVPTATPTPAPAVAAKPAPAPGAAPTPAAPQATEQPVEMPKDADTTIADVVAKEEVVEAVKENVTVSSGVAVIDKEAVEAIVEVTAEDEAVVIPLTQATAEVVEKAEINTEALSSVAEAKKDVVIEFTDFTIKLDAKAVSAIAEQAQGENIEIRVVKAENETLTPAQQKKLKDMDTAIVISAQIFSDNEYIGKFKGGKATVMLPFEIEEGRDAKDYKVYYIDEKGDLKKVAAEYVDGHMVFTTAHFSEYVIAYEGEVAMDNKEAAETDEPVISDEIAEADEADETFSWILIIGIVVLLAIAVVVMIKVKKQQK